jgi:hypothetical protein
MRSGNLGGHSVVPLRPIHPASLAPRQRDEVVLLRDKSKSSLVVRVGLHPHTVSTRHSATGDTVWHILTLLPVVLFTR